jgi:hypothetical protein
MRRFIRNNSILYPLFVRLGKQHGTGSFPNSGTGLHMTGFPRSANTYCMNIVGVVFPGMKRQRPVDC